MDEVKHHPSFPQKDQLVAACAEKIQQSFKCAQLHERLIKTLQAVAAVADSAGPVRGCHGVCNVFRVQTLQRFKLCGCTGDTWLDLDVYIVEPFRMTMFSTRQSHR
jgi:hypothetical protein